MRDLLPPRHSHQPTPNQPSIPPVQSHQVSAAALFIQKAASWFNSLSLDAYTPEVTRPSKLSRTKTKDETGRTPAVDSTKLTAIGPKHTKARSGLRKGAGKASAAVKRAAKAAVKTPAGRYAAIQGIIGIALVGMAYNTIHTSTDNSGRIFEQRNIGQTASKQISRYQFLPTPAAYIAPKVFNASDSSKSHTALKFDTWITPWNHTSISNDHSTYRTLSAFWLTVKENGYDMQPKASWDVWDSYYNSHEKAGHSYYLTVSGDPDHVFLALSEPEVQKKHIDQLLQAVEAHRFDGIDIDYEALGDENQILFSDFIRNLTEAFHRHNKKVSVTVEARIGQQHPMDWQQLSQIADEIKVMLYDYHSAKTDIPGAISPIGWLKETLDFATAHVASEKLVFGLGNYGYDWTEPSDPAESWQGTGLSFESAVKLAQEKGSTVQRAKYIDRRGYDLGLAPYFSYTDDSQRKHEVWFEDSISIQEKLDLISNYNIKGVTFWSVGSLDPVILNSQPQ